MRHSNGMKPAAAAEANRSMNSGTPTVLFVKAGRSILADMLQESLVATGLPVAVVSTAYDVVAEAQRTDGGARWLIVGVDYFGPNEYRLLPLVKREWPETVIAAYHSPGFEHKGRLAELVGADVVLSNPEAVSHFMEALAPGGPMTATEIPIAAAAPAEKHTEAVHETKPAAPEPVRGGVVPTTDEKRAEPEGPGTVELTEEELRLLLGDEEEA
ncbi:MAG TPA: hypothetical protein VMY69_01460 [Phycisphaerae bacterium]|nr:hypothetical protein [Phycisphaerae bacterium]